MTDLRDACADVSAHMRDTITLSRGRLLWGLSAVHRGVEQIDSGDVTGGRQTVALGLRFLRGMVEKP